MVRLLVAALLVALAVPAAAQEEDWTLPPEEDSTGGRHLSLTAWGGEALETGGSSRRSSTALGGEIAWAFDQLDVGVWASGYQNLRNATRAWSPVVLLRLTQRFETRRGLEAAVTFGAGAAQPSDWKVWFQLGLGVRLNLGPAFLAGEVAFEQTDLFRFSGGLGVRF